jgi:hypothetical protein
MIPLLFVQVFYGVAQHRSRHGGCVFVQEAQQSLAVLPSGLAQPPSCGLVDQVVLVLEQHLGDLERVGHVALPDEVGGADDSGAALPHVPGARQPVQEIARLVEQVASDDVGGAEVDQVPIVDPVRAPQIQIEQLLPAAFRRLVAAALLVHDAQSTCPSLVDGAFEQLLDLFWRHVDELFGEREDLAHTHPDEHVALAVLTFAGFEVPPIFFAFLWRTVRL